MLVAEPFIMTGMAENELSLRASIICHGVLGDDSLCDEIWLCPFAASVGSAAE